jgi:hypothetical protein
MSNGYVSAAAGTGLASESFVPPRECEAVGGSLGLEVLLF